MAAVAFAAGVASIGLTVPVASAASPAITRPVSPGTGHAVPIMPAQPAAPATPEPEPTSRSVAARSRMLECGHQWSSMKKAGTATGTWKDFSRGCLAQR